jgi:hypothetical protein
LPAALMLAIAIMEFARSRARQFSAPRPLPVRRT